VLGLAPPSGHPAATTAIIRYVGLEGLTRGETGEKRLRRSLAFVVGAAFVVGLVLSALQGVRDDLPAAAMDWPLLVHVLRAAVGAAVVGGLAVVLLALWRVGLPTKVSTTGVEWTLASLQAPEREVRDELLRVERESKAAIDQLRSALDGLATQPTAGDRRQMLMPLDQALGSWQTALDAALQKDAIADAVASLPEQERLVVTLSFWDGRSTREIAELLNMTEGRVAWLRSRAVKRLQDRFGDDPFAGSLARPRK
jgi:RNA polymerase sigma factor (sigma-70 family)